VDELTPDQWLDAFYKNRKGSGKRAEQDQEETA
jgi:type IV secretion system protein VirB4